MNIEENAERSTPNVQRPIISLWQPWATWILWGWKKIETRKHDRFTGLAGKRIGIHAARTMDPSWRNATAYLTAEQIQQTIEHNHVAGAVICTVHVIEHRLLTGHHSRSALIDCETVRRFGLILRPDIKELKPAVPMRGKPYLWTAEIP